MSILRGLAALGFAFLLALAPAPIPRALAKSVKDILAEVKRNPMKFYVAKGKPGACGPGCSDWIAAEGNIDPDAAVRFRQFLRTLPDTRLPVFVDSKGGTGVTARKMGDMVREHGMAAAVGRTILESRGARHRLVFQGAKCSSACVYILLGAARRTVAPGARVGVHAWQLLYKPSREQIDKRNDLLRRYAIGKGVDAALIDLALKTPSTRMRWLSRGELERFGITAAGSFATAWRLFKSFHGYWAVSSSTRAGDEGRQTTIVEIGCDFPRQGFEIVVRRELTGRELDGRSSLSLQSEAGLLWSSSESSNRRRDVEVEPVASDTLLKVADSSALVLVERFTSLDKETWTREAKLSNDGMGEALASMMKGCSS